MPPVPATKCRGRDGKCKKAKGKGKISNNLPDNQDRLPAYDGHRSGRDYADWLTTGIPALSVMADLLYWPARMISDFPDIPYSNAGGMLTESAIKGTNPRNETYGGAVPKGSRKEYGYRGGRSLAAAQSVVTVNPGAYQTPDQEVGGNAVDSPSNLGHGYTNAFSLGAGVETKTCRWSGFQSVAGQITSVKLKFDWTEQGGIIGSANNLFMVQYSLDGGASWAYVFNHVDVWGNDGSSEVILSNAQNLTQVQV